MIRAHGFLTGQEGVLTSHQPPHRSFLSISSCFKDNVSLRRIKTCRQTGVGEQSKAPDRDYKQAAFLLPLRAGVRCFVMSIINSILASA